MMYGSFEVGETKGDRSSEYVASPGEASLFGGFVCAPKMERKETNRV